MKYFPLIHKHSPHGEQFRIPWRIAEKAYEVYSKHHGKDQTLEQLAERGGFGLIELIYLLANEDPFIAKDGFLQSNFFNEFV